MYHKELKIILIEPFFSGSHRKWAEGLQKHSIHSIEIWSLPGRHWKWRMHGAAVTFAEKWNTEKPICDLIITTDLLDLATFRGLTDISVPIIHYFHENQLAYPWSHQDKDPLRKWDRRYVWINFTSAMAADVVWYNSKYNKDSFLHALPDFLQAFPDANKFNIARLREKSSVMPLGLEIPTNTPPKKSYQIPTILWNHRWEYDKKPELFFSALAKLKEDGYPFKLVVLGTHTSKYPEVFDWSKAELRNEILHFGPVDSLVDYWKWLYQCTHLPVTNQQDFFGISVVEAIAAGCLPILPRGLAYEEYVDPEVYPDLYYLPQDGIFDTLKHALEKEYNSDLYLSVKKYNWTTIIQDYDQAFVRIWSSNDKKLLS